MADDLIVRDLVKRYGNVAALDGVSFSVPAGQIFGLLGRNGAGKTTAIECIVGLRDPDAGEILIRGLDARLNRSRIKSLIGVQLQSTALQDKITPRQALKLFAAFYPRPADVELLIERFALAEKADAPFDTLSGGQRQRLALALALVNQPQILFLDEPTAGLDAPARRRLHEDIRQTRAEGRTVILTTHYMEEAHELCDEIAILARGRILAAGAPDELIAAAAQPARIDLSVAHPVDEDFFRRLPGVLEVEQRAAAWRLTTRHSSRTIAELVQALAARGNQLTDLHIREPTLEEAFIALTNAS